MNGMKIYFTLLSHNSAVIDLRTSKYNGTNLVRGAGWIKLGGKNKKMKHPLRRIYRKGSLPPPRFTGEKAIMKEVEMTETEFTELMKVLKEVWF